MSDSGETPTAGGSWRPDPTGRHKWRWRRSNGEWTSRVCGADGAFGDDPDAPLPPPRAGGSLPAVGTPNRPPRFLRQVIIGVAILVAVGVGWGIISNLMGDDSGTATKSAARVTIPEGMTSAEWARRNVTTTTAATGRPRWCSHYDDWKRASDTMDGIAARHGSNVTRWPDGVYEQWERAFNQQMRAADILWDGTEAGSVPRGWDARARACR